MDDNNGTLDEMRRPFGEGGDVAGGVEAVATLAVKGVCRETSVINEVDEDDEAEAAMGAVVGRIGSSFAAVAM